MSPLHRDIWTRLISTRRCFSSGPPTAQHSIYISNSTNPYFNLTFEDWSVSPSPPTTTTNLNMTNPIWIQLGRLFRHKPPTDPLLLIYRDDPCVVIGRNQNPWKEVNMAALRRSGIPFVRRRSGGGTVYHVSIYDVQGWYSFSLDWWFNQDLGNTNFSIHLPRPSFDRHVTARIVLRAVRSMSIDAHINERNDICVGKDKISVFRSVCNLCRGW